MLATIPHKSISWWIIWRFWTDINQFFLFTLCFMHSYYYFPKILACLWDGIFKGSTSSSMTNISSNVKTDNQQHSRIHLQVKSINIHNPLSYTWSIFRHVLPEEKTYLLPSGKNVRKLLSIQFRKQAPERITIVCFTSLPSEKLIKSLKLFKFTFETGIPYLQNARLRWVKHL